MTGGGQQPGLPFPQRSGHGIGAIEPLQLLLGAPQDLQGGGWVAVGVGDHRPRQADREGDRRLGPAGHGQIQVALGRGQVAQVEAGTSEDQVGAGRAGILRPAPPLGQGQRLLRQPDTFPQPTSRGHRGQLAKEAHHQTVAARVPGHRQPRP